MSTHQADAITVGKVVIPFLRAEQWVRAHTDLYRNRVAADPYAYPAYDRFEVEHNAPDRLSDGDLLAPVLLNVRLSLRAFYGLQRIRPDLERALRHEDLQIPLRDLNDPDRVAAAVGSIYQVLDGRSAPRGVLGTTLSNVLHRKRPDTLVLHDTWVRTCYVGKEDDAPVPVAKRRSWAEYMSLLSVAIGDDLRRQEDLFARLEVATGAPGALTAMCDCSTSSPGCRKAHHRARPSPTRTTNRPLSHEACPVGGQCAAHGHVAPTRADERCCHRRPCPTGGVLPGSSPV